MAQQLIGIVVLIILAIIIIAIRSLIQQRGGPVLNGAMKVGDFFIWIRFIGGIAIAAVLLVLLLVFRKK